MSFLDRFRTKPPAKSPRGESGRAHFDGFIQTEELNSKLAGVEGLKIFDTMYRTDPDVRRNVWMICNLLIGATWTVEPFGGENASKEDLEAAKAVEWALFENMTPSWKGHLGEALPVGIRSGFAPFEAVWENVEWEGRDLIVPKLLDLRLPRTITRFYQEDGQLTGIEQQLLRAENGVVDIPIEDLLYYRFGAEGDNWEGISLLRAAYKPWYLKDKIERLDAIKQEREAVGIPICYPPRNATPEQLTEMEEILGNTRSGEQAFIIAPGPKAEDLGPEEAGLQGWRIDILGQSSGDSSSKTSDTKPSLEYHSDKIAAAFLAEFMRLGQGTGAVGARATADVQQNPFLQSAEALASTVESVANGGLVERMTALNFNVDGPPRLCMSLVDSTTLEELATYVKNLIEAEALEPDPDLEDFLRDHADLPPADPNVRKQKQELKKKAAEALLNPADPNEPPDPNDPNAPPPKPGDPKPPAPKPPAKKPPAKPAAPPVPPREPDEVLERPKWGRELRSWEKLMALEEIDTAIAQARERLEEAAGPETRRLASDFTKAALGGKKQPSTGTDLEDAIGSELERLYRTGQATVRQELDAQRGKSVPVIALIGTAELDQDTMRQLAQRAKLASASIAGRIWQAVSRSVLNKPGDQAAAQVAGEAEGSAALRAEAQLHAAGSLNQGRSDQADVQSDEVRGSRYTSILDTNRCAECASADDDVLRPLDDPVRLQRKPPNAGCYGGGRCRCMEFFELKEEAPGYGGPAAPPPDPMNPPGPGGLAADHFNVAGGNPNLRGIVEDQINAIEQVHGFPAGMPRIPLNIGAMKSTTLGELAGTYDILDRTWVGQTIRLNRSALMAEPPITSTAHEIGHFLDSWGFGDGPPHDAIVLNMPRQYLSSTDAMLEWREAVSNTHSYRNLVLAGQKPDKDYLLYTKELFARSYEQYIATKTKNKVLLEKIVERRRENPNLYWDVADFEPVLEAFDRFLKTRGLLK